MAANVASLSESPKALIYPSAGNVQSDIPLWMKFYCYEYTNTALGRVIAQNVSNGGANVSLDAGAIGFANTIIPIPGLSSKEKAQIFLPAPVNFQTNTAHRYEPAATSQTHLLPNYFSALFNALPDSIKNNIPNLSDYLDEFIGTIEKTVGDLTGFESELKGLEYKDSTFMDGGPSRTYEVRFNLPCLTVADSQKAGQIIRAFEALSLPTARSFLSLTTTKAFHPPLWIFGIGPINQRKYDADWTGMPQISVLRAVSHKKTAFETNALAALGLGNILKPVCYTLSLSFIELEPAFRATAPGKETSLQIINRSTVISTTGMSGVFAK
jgi:hypothetical protein